MTARMARGALACGALACGALACGGDDSRDQPRAPDALLGASAIVRMQSLATASSPQPYVVDSAGSVGARGRIRALVRFEGRFPPDTLIRPTHDAPTCTPVASAPFVGTPGGVGDAVAWLVGVRRGPADLAPRRVALDLTGCQIQPRVSRVSVGATLLVRSADAIDARLRFVDVMDDRPGPAGGDSTPSALVVAPVAPRALVPLFDAGVVVPLSTVTEAPGLVEIRDDRHPWVRGWLAVAPHPFVAISDRGGRFTFDAVPTGTYVLVVWHERLGTEAISVRVERGVETRVTITLPGAP